MRHFRVKAALVGIAMTAAFAAPSHAVKITNASDCSSEGGQMLNVKGSDFCLVPIRDEAYAGPEYDGNQLGVVDCPGSKLNDGSYCMYPVTLKNRSNVEVIKTPEAVVTTTVDEDAAVDGAVETNMKTTGDINVEDGVAETSGLSKADDK